MTLPNPGQNGDLRNLYGYRDHRCWDLDRTASAWATKLSQGHGRLFELKIDQTKQKKDGPSTGSMTAAEAEFFMHGARTGFRHIARRHNLRPMEMWNKVAQGLVVVGMHQDDLDDVQELVFGWKELDAEMLERYRWRYPDRCPLLDVLCTMDESCQVLNEVQDWILELKGSKDRRRLDMLPALPDPDGVRQPPKERVAGCISFSQLLDEDLF